LGAHTPEVNRKFNSIAMPTVSVIIPFLNTAPYLAEAVRSVAAQTHRDLELIVVDDGSTDASFEVAAASLKNYSLRGDVLRRPPEVRKGPGACRNLGAAKASGSLLAFLDSDDLWLPHHLERAAEAFQKAGAAMGAYCAMGRFFNEGGTGRTSPENGFQVSGLANALPLFLRGMSIPNISVCVRRDAFDKTTGYSEALSCYEDWWLMLQLAKTAKFYFNPEVDVFIRERQDSLSRQTRSDGKSLAMSSAMYRDQLRLYSIAEGASLFSRSELGQLGEMIVGWNTRQLSDLACGGYFKEAHRVLRALTEAGMKASPLISRILAKTLGDVLKRAGAKALRMTSARTSLP
jgi:glycosyltransferase involved in cell wall biosynthesis